MQEGATRMGINLVLYFLTHGGRVESEFLNRTSVALRRSEAESRPAVPAGLSRDLDGFTTPSSWQHEEWSDDGSLGVRGERLAVGFARGSEGKSAFSMPCSPPVRLAAGDVIALDAESLLRCGCRLSLAVVVKEKYYETEPFYLKPGRQTAFFRVSARTFKSEDTNWEYRDSLPGDVSAERLTFLVYSPVGGEILLGNARVITPEGSDVSRPPPPP
jgi:hypothetical protein